MLDSAVWVLLTIAGPAILAATIGYVMIKYKLSPQDRRELHDIGEFED